MKRNHRLASLAPIFFLLLIITVSENFHGAGIDKVETKIPRAQAIDGLIFLRLHSQE